ncbi:hypothetical protein BVC80_829g5 [Macleaya cordata]|uniref:Uncharacterized protein n=1 Tax=Macleaya cordata TaxID=56857 RepID=A0A200PZQ7_MACCD|nr:hypothetical protein BVC80_829g5 [Macleaya cordata]
MNNPPKPSQAMRYTSNTGEFVHYVYTRWDINTDIQEIQHQTRAGRIFKPPNLRAENPFAALHAPPIQIPIQMTKDLQVEDQLFMNQLQKTKANVSIWGLLEASIGHREALNSMHVATGITPAELVNAIAPASKKNFIFFSDEDLLPHEGS